MKDITLLIIVFVLNSCKGQDSNSDWKRLENISLKDKTKYILSLKNEFPYFYDLEKNPESYISRFTFIDLDKDGDNDLIYIGESGAESKCIRIFLNKKNAFKKVFDEFSSKPLLTFKNNQLINLKVFQTQCCGESWNIHIKYFFIKTTTNVFIDNKISDYYIFEANEEPLNYTQPYRVKTNTTVNVRYSPKIGVIVKKAYKEELKMSENIIGNLRANIAINVLGEKIDNSDGRTWLYIQADKNQFNKDNFVIIGDESDFTIRGWVSKKNIEKVIIKTETDISDNVSSKWIGNYQRQFNEKFTDGTTSLWTWTFLINKDKAVFKSDIYPSDTKYKVIEKNNQLELFCPDNDCGKKTADFIIKKENNNFYLKGDAFENDNKWLLFEKNK
jgi:hypothetical protein